MTTASTGPLIPRRRLGAAFRELREARGETLQMTAGALMFSPSKLSRIENGLGGEPHPRDVRDLINHFELQDTDHAERLEELARAGRVPGWWQVPPYQLPSVLDMFISYESTASRIDEYAPTVVPGLLQTREYAREVFAAFLADPTPDAIELMVEVRMQRQQQLRRRTTPRLHVVPETILHRRVGSPAVMHEQLTALLEVFDDPMVKLRLIPYTAGLYDGVDLTTVTVFEFDAPGDDDIVTIERARHVEFFDRPRTVQKYRGIIDQMSHYWLDKNQSRSFIEREKRKWQD